MLETAGQKGRWMDGIRSRIRNSSLGGRLALMVLVVLTVSSLVVVLVVRDTLREHVLEGARERAELLIDRSLSVHSYINEELKPQLFDLTAPLLSEESFDPSWMSSTYAVRRIGSYAETGAGSYYYKECAVNARSPENEADSDEAAFLKALNEEPDLRERSGVRAIDGEEYFFLLRRGETMQTACLRCHSTPDAAPAAMVAIYGPDRSFGRHEGEVVSAISIRIPMAVANAEADRVTWRLSAVLLAVLVLMLVATYLYIDREAVRPLAAMATASRDIASGRRSLRSGTGVTGAREISELSTALGVLATTLDDHINELRSAYEDVAESNATRGRFLNNLSHELRTPLNSIIGFSGLLLQGHAGSLTAQQREELVHVSNAGRHMLSLVEELLDYSAIRAGADTVTPVRFNMCEAIVGAVKMVEPLAAEKDIALTVVECEDREILTDRVKLSQILINLVGNAVKFTDSGSVSVTARMQDAELIVQVSDTGPGIPPAQMDSVFDEFHQVRADAGMKPAGTGLGLTVARALARKLGGDVTAESLEGVGTTMTLRLPGVL